MLPVVVLDPQQDDLVLDLCAAPGSKTSFLAQRMGNTGMIVANEPSGSRAKKLAANLDRTASFNTVMIQSDGTILNSFIGQEFDRILLDAPCSSEGYGRRDNTFFTKMWSEPKILMAAKLQKRLIESSWEMLAPGGTMVYSTCTSAPEENECVVQHLIDTYPETVEILPTGLVDVPLAKSIKSWEGQVFDNEIVEHAQRFYPHLSSETWNSESFFVCKLRKTTGVKRLPAKKPSQITQVKVLKKNQNAEIVTKLANKFGLDNDWPQLLMDGKPQFYIKQHDLYLTTLAATNFMQNNLFRRVGLRVSDKDENLTTEFAMQLGTHATINVAELDADQTDRWLQGFDIPTTDETLNSLKDGTAVLVRHQNFGLGWGKVIKGKIKNKLDRDLVF
jgi:16S rRNA (cytosine1407-C5)-methyltransferase